MLKKKIKEHCEVIKSLQDEVKAKVFTVESLTEDLDNTRE